MKQIPNRITPFTLFTKYLLLLPLFFLASCQESIKNTESTLHINEGFIALEKADYGEAIQRFRKAIANPHLPNDQKANTYRNMAQAFIDLEEVDSAIHYSSLALPFYDKDSYEYLVNAADVDIMKGNTEEALKKLHQAYPLNPSNVIVNNSLGLLYMGVYDITVEDLEKALYYNLRAYEADPSRSTTQVLAENYLFLEDYTSAEKYYTELYQKHPDIPTHALYLGMTYFKLNKLKEADTYFEKALKLEPKFEEFIVDYKAGRLE